MENLIKGQKIDVTKNNFGYTVNRISVCFNWYVSSQYQVDTRAFLLNNNGKIGSPRDLVDQTNTSASGNYVQYKSMPMYGYLQSFDVELANVPASVEKIAFVVSLRGESGGNLSVISNLNLKVIFNQEIDLFQFNVTQQMTQEKALIIGELYRYKGEWKFNAVGAGFFGGLTEICNSFGANVPQPTQPPQHQSNRLLKVTLEKKGDEVSLVKKFTRVDAKLTWTQAVDLDLHAFYILKNGKFGHVYYSDKGKVNKSPYIQLDQDAGVGNTAGDNEENLVIGTLKDIKYLILATNIFRFFSSFSSGDNFALYDGKVVVKTDAGDQIDVPLNSRDIGKWCLIAKIDNSDEKNPKIININKVIQKEPVASDLY